MQIELDLYFRPKPYVFVRTLLWQFDSQIDLPLYVSQVFDSIIIVIWKCIEFALLTFDLVSFERTLLIALCFLYILVSPDLFHALLSLFDKIEPRVLFDWTVIECFLGNTISLGCWIVIRTYLVPPILRSIPLNLITVFYLCTCRSWHFMHHLVAYIVPYFGRTWIFEIKRAWSSIRFMKSIIEII